MVYSWCSGARTSLATSWGRPRTRSTQPAGRSSGSSSTGPSVTGDTRTRGEAHRIGATLPAAGTPAEGAVLDLHGLEGFNAASRTCIPSQSARLTSFSGLASDSPRATASDRRSGGEARFARNESVQPRGRRHEAGAARRKDALAYGSFRVYKFRSMNADADSRVHERHIAAIAIGLRHRARPTRSGSSSKTTRDHRVSRCLRLRSVDELPQLINVVRGEMSLVGPRPVPVYESGRYRPEHMSRFTVLPGISGLWQVRGRCALSTGRWSRTTSSTRRTNHCGWISRVMVRTLPAVISMRGAG